MLNPSTRATCTPNVTISVAYTAADSSVWTAASASRPIRFHAPASSTAVGVGTAASVATSSLTAGATVSSPAGSDAGANKGKSSSPWRSSPDSCGVTSTDSIRSGYHYRCSSRPGRREGRRPKGTSQRKKLGGLSDGQATVGSYVPFFPRDFVGRSDPATLASAETRAA